MGQEAKASRFPFIRQLVGRTTLGNNNDPSTIMKQNWGEL